LFAQASLYVPVQSLPERNYVFAACRNLIYSYTAFRISDSKPTKLSMVDGTTTSLQISAALLVFILNPHLQIISLCQILRRVFVTLQRTKPLMSSVDTRQGCGKIFRFPWLN
jgi:hypothetical protein